MKLAVFPTAFALMLQGVIAVDRDGAIPQKPKIMYRNSPLYDGQVIIIEPDPDTSNTLVFTCVANGGYPKPVFKWIVNESTRVWDNYPKAESVIYITFGNQEYITRHHSAKAFTKITCIVNHDGYAGGESTVFVGFAGVNADHAIKLIVERGKDAVFNCSTAVDDRCTFIEPEWTRLVDNHQVLPTHLLNPALRDRVKVKDQHTCVVILSQVKNRDSGVYTCSLANFRTVRFNLTVVDSASPKGDEPIYLTVKQGQDAVFECSTETERDCSFRDPSGTRLVDDHQVTPLHYILTRYENRVSVKDTNTCVITIFHVTNTDAGIYVCALPNFRTVKINLRVVESKQCDQCKQLKKIATDLQDAVLRAHEQFDKLRKELTDQC